VSFPRYPKYKPSGVEWLGEVPDHWEVKRLRRLVSLNPSKSETALLPSNSLVSFLPMEAIGQNGSIDLGRQCVLSEVASGYSYFRDGDVVIAKITPCFENGKGALLRGMTNSCGFGTTELIVMRPDPASMDPEFLQRLVTSDSFRKLGEASMYGAGGQKRVPDDFAREFATPLPPLPEQRAIAAFLDRETAKIDALITEQEKLIELLAEKRQAVISHAVTKGLNPNAPMKPSGVEWLGEVPAHWEVCQSRRMFAVRSEPAWPDDRMLTASQKYGVLYQSDFVDIEGRRVVEVIKGTESLKHVEPDDFIISMRSFQGGIEWCRLRGSTSFHYVMLKPIKWVHPPFFAHVLKSSQYIQALRTTTDLIRDGQELRFSHFAQVALPVVPQDEQVGIAAHIDRETARFDALTKEAESAITLLRERRAALISAAVTGQIDVRDQALEMRA
jgi:type I restriction enzyme S subunit